MKRIVLGILLILCANVFWYIPNGPTALSLPFAWTGVGLIIYGISKVKRGKVPQSTANDLN